MDWPSSDNEAPDPDDDDYGAEFEAEEMYDATQRYEIPDDVADEFNDEAEEGVMVMDGGAGDEAGALAADGEEWDWKSRLAPLEEEEAAAAAKRSLEDREEDDGAWRDEDDYGNPTAEKKVKLSKEKADALEQGLCPGHPNILLTSPACTESRASDADASRDADDAENEVRAREAETWRRARQVTPPP